MMNLRDIKKIAEQERKNGNQNFHKPESKPVDRREERVPETETMEVDWEVVLRRVSLFFGVFVAVISIYFSYDGFDNSVTGGNASYSTWAKIIGVVLACSVTVLQFVFSSAYSKLNATLKLFGLASYAYSMWTNYQGIVHILGMDKTMAIVATLFMDGVPEPLIAWSLGASLQGDFVGNILKTIGGVFGVVRPTSKKRDYHYDVRGDYRDRLGK